MTEGLHASRVSWGLSPKAKEAAPNNPLAYEADPQPFAPASTIGEYRASVHVRGRHRTEDTAVVKLITVVVQDKIAVRRNDKWRPARQRIPISILVLPADQVIRVRFRLQWKIAERPPIRQLTVGFADQLAISDQLSLFNFDSVTG